MTEGKRGYLTVKELAELAGVSESTVRHWIGSRQLGAYGLPGSRKQPIWRIPLADWQRFLDTRRRETA